MYVVGRSVGCLSRGQLELRVQFYQSSTLCLSEEMVRFLVHLLHSRLGYVLHAKVVYFQVFVPALVTSTKNCKLF